MISSGLIFHIINEISDAENIDPNNLPTLNDVIDPDAITTLVTADTKHDPDLVVAFTYYGYRITVYSPDKVSIQPADPNA